MIKQKAMDLTLRPATIDDTEYIFQLRVLTMKPFFKDTLGWNDTEEREKAAEQLNHARIVMDGSKDIGVIKIIPGARELHLHQLQILPEFQKKGIGANLIRQVIEQSERLQKPISLFVMKNTPAKHLYDRFDFTVTDEYDHNCKMIRPTENNPG